MAGSSSRDVYYFIRTCPVQDGCSSQCWKRAGVWSWDVEDCKSRLVSHLVNSSYHGFDLADAMIYAEDVQIETGTNSEPPQKRPRPAQPDHPPPHVVNPPPHMVKDEEEQPAEVTTLMRAEGDVIFNKVQFGMLADSIGRASLAVKQAARVSAAAARAFSDEAANLDQCKATLESIAAKAELDSTLL